MQPPRQWQIYAMDRLRQANYCGIVQASTGTGKSYIGLKYIEEHPKEKVLIVVPTSYLQKQWYEELLKNGLCQPHEVTFLGGGHKKQMPTTRITIGVINSLQKINWAHPLARFEAVLYDECHRYASTSSLKVLVQGQFNHKIGFSATLSRPDMNHKYLLQFIGPIVYTINNADSIAAGYISDYSVVNIACSMNEKEYIEYSKLQAGFTTLMNLFNNNYKTALAIATTQYNNPVHKQAVELMRHVQSRKDVIQNTNSKLPHTMNIIAGHQQERIIIFNELQSSAEQLHTLCKEQGLNVSLYHSKMTPSDRKEEMRKFIDHENNILITVKALDEGLNVPDVSIGIIVNGNSQDRQSLQRLGRILRKVDGKNPILYMLYTKGTHEFGYITKRMKCLGKTARWVN